MHIYTAMNRNRGAFAFSITMWIVVSLMFATVIILRFAKDELEISKELSNKIETQSIAEDILEVLKFYVPAADYTSVAFKDMLLDGSIYNLPKEIVVDGREYNLSNGISLSMQDTSALLNVLYDSSVFISDTLTEDSSLRSRLKNSLDDWRDSDDVAKTNGAEQNSYYLEHRKSLLKVRNANFIQDVHELALIKGFGKINFEDIHNNLYYGEPGIFNLALINNSNYISSLLKITPRESISLLNLRKNNLKEFIKIVSGLKNFNDMYMGFVLERQLLIKIKVRKGRAKSVLESIINFSSFDRPYIVLSYKIR